MFITNLFTTLVYLYCIFLLEIWFVTQKCFKNNKYRKTNDIILFVCYCSFVRLFRRIHKYIYLENVVMICLMANLCLHVSYVGPSSFVFSY